MKWPRILNSPLNKREVKALAEEFFGDMIKIVVDIELGEIAVGGSLHADAEGLLLKKGSTQVNIWGANYFPGRAGGKRLECSALINIRPRKGNRSQIIRSATVRKKVEGIAGEYFEL